MICDIQPYQGWAFWAAGYMHIKTLLALTIFEKRSILDEWQGSEYAFVVLLPLHNNNNKEIWYRYP